MKTIAIEEHFKIPAIIEANSGGAQEKAFKLFGSKGICSTGENGEVPAGSLDIGLKRLAAMDAGGIDLSPHTFFIGQIRITSHCFHFFGHGVAFHDCLFG
jgi:hypothetical protein